MTTVDSIDMREVLNPDDHTVDEVKEIVRDSDYNDGQLYHLEEYERDNKSRVTLTEWLAERHDYTPNSVEVDDEATATDPTPSREGPPRTTDSPRLGDAGYDPATMRAWEPGEVPSPDECPLVAVRPPNEGGYAGYWFENGRARVVTRNRRVDDAIADGPLDYIEERPNNTDGEYL